MKALICWQSLDRDLDRLNVARGLVGSRQQNIARRIDKSMEEQTRLKEVESEHLDELSQSHLRVNPSASRPGGIASAHGPNRPHDPVRLSLTNHHPPLRSSFSNTTLCQIARKPQGNLKG